MAFGHIPHTRYITKYDIHVKKIDVINIPDLDQRLEQILSLEKECAALRESRGIYRPERLDTRKNSVRLLDLSTAYTASPNPSNMMMELNDNDIYTYREHGLIELDHTNAAPNVRLFSTTEDKPLNGKPKRRRGITHTPFNECNHWFEKSHITIPVHAGPPGQ